MNYSESNTYSLVPFLEIYEQHISTRLQTIDLFLKTSEAPYDIHETSKVLDLNFPDLMEIMINHEIAEITLIDFFTIVFEGTSYICKLLQREWKYGKKSTYAVKDIANIYELNPKKIKSAMTKTNTKMITTDNLRKVFSEVYVPIVKYQAKA